MALACGAAMYMLAPDEPGWSSLVASVAAPLVLKFAVDRMAPGWLGSALVLLSAYGAGGLAAKVRVASVDDRTVSSDATPRLVEGWVVAIEPGTNGPRLRLRVHAVEGWPPDHQPHTVRLTHGNRLGVAPGRFVRCWAVMRPPPGPSLPGDYDFRRQAWFERLHGVGYVLGRCRGGVLGNPAALGDRAGVALAALRRQLADHVAQAAGPRAGGLAATLASGDRSGLSQADQEALRGSGLAHLLAISGLHMGIVCGLVYLLVRRGLALVAPLALRWPVQRVAAAAALLAGGIYLALSGASVSTQRAYIMAAVFFGAILMDRSPVSLRSFAIALAAIVILYPETVLSPGFQMSFAATGALIATYVPWAMAQQTDGRSKDWTTHLRTALAGLAVTSIVAAAATAPFAWYHFGRSAPMGLVANLLAMPIVSFVSAPAAALSLLLAPVGLDGVGLRLFGLSLEWVLAIAYWAAGDEPARVAPMPGAALLAFTGALASHVLLLGWPRWLLVGGLAAGGYGLWAFNTPPAFAIAPSGEVFVMRDGAVPDRIAWHEAGGLPPLRHRGVPVTRGCGDRLCEVDLARDWRLILHPPGADPTCAQTGTRKTIHLLTDEAEMTGASPQRLAGPACGHRIVFTDPAVSAGQAWHLTPGSPRPVRPACRDAPGATPGGRPWAPCIRPHPPGTANPTAFSSEVGAGSR